MEGSIECYFCKKELFTKNLKESLKSLAKKNGWGEIFLISNQKKFFGFVCKECFEELGIYE